MWESFYSLEFCWKTSAKCGNPNTLFRMCNLESGWRNESHSRSLNYAKVSAELIVATDLSQWRERVDDNGVSLGKRSSDVVTRPCSSSLVHSFNHTTDCKFDVIETTMFAGWNFCDEEIKRIVNIAEECELVCFPIDSIDALDRRGEVIWPAHLILICYWCHVNK